MKLLIIFCIISALFANHTKYILWVGYTQSGKSSAIKLLTGNNTIQIGKEDAGKSTTAQITIYDEIKPKLNNTYKHIDTIGFGDNSLKYNDEKIGELIEQAILEQVQLSKFKISAVIITESYLSDAKKFENVFAHLKQIVGYIPFNSIIVLLTKRNAVSKSFAKNRRASIQQSLQKYGIPPLKIIDFLTPYSTDNINQSNIPQYQYKQLQNAIKFTRRVQMDKIQYKQKQIQSIASRICKQQVSEVPYNQTKTYKENITYYEQKYQSCTCFYKHGWIFTDDGICNNQYKVSQCRWKQQQKQVIVPKIRYIYPNVSLCYPQAKKQYQQNSRASQQKYRDEYQ